MKRDEELHPEVLRRVMEVVDRLSRDSSFALVCAHAYIELLISVLVEQRCKNGKRMVKDSRAYPHSTQLVILNELGLLSDPLFRQLDYLRKLRNKCAHTPLFRLTDADMEKFRELGVSLPKGTIEDGRITFLLQELIRKTWEAGENVFVLRLLLA